MQYISLLAGTVKVKNNIRGDFHLLTSRWEDGVSVLYCPLFIVYNVILYNRNTEWDTALSGICSEDFKF